MKCVIITTQPNIKDVDRHSTSRFFWVDTDHISWCLGTLTTKIDLNSKFDPQCWTFFIIWILNNLLHYNKKYNNKVLKKGGCFCRESLLAQKWREPSAGNTSSMRLLTTCNIIRPQPLAIQVWMEDPLSVDGEKQPARPATAQRWPASPQLRENYVREGIATD